MRTVVALLLALAACGKEKAPEMCEPGQYWEYVAPGEWRCRDACPKGQRVAYAADGTNLGCEPTP